jgi:hypothetical protein
VLPLFRVTNFESDSSFFSVNQSNQHARQSQGQLDNKMYWRVLYKGWRYFFYDKASSRTRENSVVRQAD